MYIHNIDTRQNNYCSGAMQAYNLMILLVIGITLKVINSGDCRTKYLPGF